MALKQAEIQKLVKDTGLKIVLTQTDFNYVQYDEHSIAIPVRVEGKDCYAKVTIVCGQLKDTKTSKAFDPYIAQEEWEIDKEFRAKVKAEKEKAKADKIAKSKK